ncbi:MAG: HAD-IA family hydrolase [Nitrospirota bacterium]|jgi:putative hydrolase of the HAD superfamily
MSPPTQALFFDAVGTLFQVKGSVGDVYRRVATRHRPEIDAADLDTAFHEVIQASRPLRFPGLSGARLHQIETQWWYDVVYKVFGRFDLLLDFDEYQRDIYEVFRSAEGWELYPETQETLVALRERGYKLAVVSNFDSRLPDVLAALGIADLFDDVIFATLYGLAKPDAELFRIPLRHLDVAAETVVHVGDHMEEDVAGSRAVGLRPILVSRDRGRLPTIDLPAIRTLDELLGLLPERAGG